ncbi:MAG TPA: hypothetical protein VEO53_18965 [Candidatus Binatia bacterium]|nr:hypothetical protein [Candidatus Binatia bacterium]
MFAVHCRDAHMRRGPLARESRLAQFQVPCLDLAEYSQHRQSDPDSHRAWAQVVGHVLAVAAKDGKQAPSSLPVLQPGWLSRQGVAVVRRVCLCLVQMVKATGLLVQEALP